jgi:magnesium-transporting ATPase (P-type)
LIFTYEDQKHYSGTSQDEIILIEASKESNIVTFTGRTSDHIEIKVGSGKDEENTESYKIVKLHEFTNERKMMSIVVQDQNGKHFIFAKGADTSI